MANSIVILAVFFSFIFPVSFSCYYHHHCPSSGNPNLPTFCLRHAQVCLHTSSHQSQTPFSVTTLSEVISKTNLNPLSQTEQRTIINASILFISQINPHIFIHRNIYDVNPVARLQALDALITNGSRINNLNFHLRMMNIFSSMNDFHTVYVPPAPLNRTFALLPFSVRRFFDPTDTTSTGSPRDRYLVDDVISELINIPGFTQGVELLTYDHLPVGNAVRRLGRQGYASNFDARLANGVIALYSRLLSTENIPFSPRITIEFRYVNGTQQAAEFDWIFLEQRNENVAEALVSRLHPHLHMEGKRKASSLDSLDASIKTDILGNWSIRAPQGDAEVIPVSSNFSSVFSASILQTMNGRIGYLRVLTFSVQNLAGASAELTRILNEMRLTGLVLDIRGNRGGSARLVDAVIQILHGRSIGRLSASSRATSVLATFLASLPPSIRAAFPLELSPALGTALAAGEPFTGAYPFIGEAEVLERERAYFGPVVTLVDGRVFSAADLYASLQVDLNISTVVGVDNNIGAGGATGPRYSIFVAIAPGLFPSLPRGIDFSSAQQRVFREGRASGAILEFFGVRPNIRYFHTRRDVLEEDCDLFDFLARTLRGMQA